MDENLRRLERLAANDPAYRTALFNLLWRSGDYCKLESLLKNSAFQSDLVEFLDSLVPTYTKKIVKEPEENLPILAWLTDKTNRYPPTVYPWFYWACSSCGGVSDDYKEVSMCCTKEWDGKKSTWVTFKDACKGLERLGYDENIRREGLSEREAEYSPDDFETHDDYIEALVAFRNWEVWANTYIRCPKKPVKTRRNPDAVTSGLLKEFLATNDSVVLDRFLVAWERNPELGMIESIISRWNQPTRLLVDKIENIFRKTLHQPKWQEGRVLFRIEEDYSVHEWTPAYARWSQEYDRLNEILIRLLRLKNVDLEEDYPSDLPFYRDSHTTITYLELHDRHTAYKLRPPAGLSDAMVNEEFHLQVDLAIEHFRETTKIPVYVAGRSGRHVVVDDNLDNRLVLRYLIDLAVALEQDVIKNTNAALRDLIEEQEDEEGNG